MTMTWTTLAAITGVVTGSVGTLLGIWNTVQNMVQNRLRVQVVPISEKRIYGMDASGATFKIEYSNSNIISNDVCLEVTNHSRFPVTVAEVGFLLENGTRKAVQDRFLPKTLESRSATKISVGPFPQATRRVYVTTQCGHTFYGNGSVLRKWHKMSTQ